jgi:hypothetical protein
MKKFLFAAIIAAMTIGIASVPTVKADAQSTKVSTKTITAADTSTFSNVPSKIVSVTYTYTETSGTTAGKVYLEVSGDNLGWVAIDSLTLGDVTTKQVLKTNFTSTHFLSCRWRNTNTSSATGSVKYSYLRRTDE